MIKLASWNIRVVAAASKGGSGLNMFSSLISFSSLVWFGLVSNLLQFLRVFFYLTLIKSENIIS